MPNESEALNFTTPSTTTLSGLRVLSTLQNEATQSVHNEKKKALGKASKMHSKESHGGHHQEPNPTWTKFPWGENVCFFLFITLLFDHFFGLRIINTIGFCCL